MFTQKLDKLPHISSFILLWSLTLTSNAFSSSISIAWEGPPRSVDPRYANDADSQYLADLLHCSLMGFDQSGTLYGDLADSWQWITPTKLSIKIKKNAIFANGQSVTAEDVQNTYNFFSKKDLKKPTPLSGAFKNIKSISSPKNDEVEFELHEADASFLTNLMIGILPKSQTSDQIIEDPTQISGCGPFLLKKQEVSGITLGKNSQYSLGKVAAAETIIIKFVKEESTRFAKLRKGELDIVQNSISRDKLKDIAKKEHAFNIIRKPSLSTSYLGFNMKDPILQNAKVRKAIAHAINRELIIKYLLNGFATPATSLLTPADPFLNRSIAPIPFNPDLSKQLLDEAGYKTKEKYRFALTYKTTQNNTRIAIAKAIASDLKRIGIDVKVQPLEWGRFKSDVESGNVQLWSLTWVGFKDPDIFRYAFGTENFAPNGGNRGYYSNIELDQLLTKGKKTVNFNDRKKIYDDVQLLISNELPYVNLWHEDNFAIVHKSVQGFDIYADGRYTALKSANKQ